MTEKERINFYSWRAYIFCELRRTKVKNWLYWKLDFNTSMAECFPEVIQFKLQANQVKQEIQNL